MEAKQHLMTLSVILIAKCFANFQMTRNHYVIETNTTIFKSKATLQIKARSAIECVNICSSTHACCSGSFDTLLSECYLDPDCLVKRQTVLDSISYKKKDICKGGAFEFFFTNACIKSGICQKQMCLKQDAQHVCQENNATLVKLGSPEKNMAVQTYIGSKGSLGVAYFTADNNCFLVRPRGRIIQSTAFCNHPDYKHGYICEMSLP